MVSKKILFEGFYGFRNTGDDAFVEVSSWGSRKFWNCENNVFIGRDLPIVKHPINQKQILKNLKGFDRVNLLAHLKNSDYVISSGGSTFQKLPFHSNKQVARRIKNLRPSLRLGAIGVSIGPFDNIADEKKVIEYLKHLDFLAVRDTSSFEYASSLHLPFKPINAFDLAALLPRVYQNKRKKEPGEEFTIGLSICNYERYYNGDLTIEKKRNEYFKELVILLNKISNIRFRAFIFNGNKNFGDEKITMELIDNLPVEKVELEPYSFQTEATWNKITECDLMISTRLHASIFACYSGTPFMLFEYHQKCTDFLNDIGHDQKYRLYDAEADMQEILKTIEEIREGHYIPPVNLGITIERALKNFTGIDI